MTCKLLSHLPEPVTTQSQRAILRLPISRCQPLKIDCTGGFRGPFSEAPEPVRTCYSLRGKAVSLILAGTYNLEKARKYPMYIAENGLECPRRTREEADNFGVVPARREAQSGRSPGYSSAPRQEAIPYPVLRHRSAAREGARHIRPQPPPRVARTFCVLEDSGGGRRFSSRTEEVPVCTTRAASAARGSQIREETLNHG